MLCPLPADPFIGQWYRSAAVVHEAMLCPLCSKLMCLYQGYINKVSAENFNFHFILANQLFYINFGSFELFL
jgi:TMEM164 family